ncbi:Uncharacterised protein [Fusobacterium necrophorum subsp. necrophorum]|nr:Uncharacterised protein [Fusobacterium necrophorum subsp. necrophorum]
MAFKNRIMLEIEPMAEIKTVDMNSFWKALKKFLDVFSNITISQQIETYEYS